jgi:hypothetical protein
MRISRELDHVKYDNSLVVGGGGGGGGGVGQSYNVKLSAKPFRGSKSGPKLIVITLGVVG